MADQEDFDQKNIILDTTKNPIIANAISPLTRPIAHKSLPEAPGIVGAFKVLADPRGDERGIEAVHLLQLLQCPRSVLNTVPHLQP